MIQLDELSMGVGAALGSGVCQQICGVDQDVLVLGEINLEDLTSTNECNITSSGQVGVAPSSGSTSSRTKQRGVGLDMESSSGPGEQSVSLGNGPVGSAVQRHNGQRTLVRGVGRNQKSGRSGGRDSVVEEGHALDSSSEGRQR